MEFNINIFSLDQESMNEVRCTNTESTLTSLSQRVLNESTGKEASSRVSANCLYCSVIISLLLIISLGDESSRVWPELILA